MLYIKLKRKFFNCSGLKQATYDREGQACESVWQQKSL